MEQIKIFTTNMNQNIHKASGNMKVLLKELFPIYKDCIILLNQIPKEKCLHDL